MKLSKLDPDFYAGSVAALPVFFMNDQDGETVIGLVGV
jgi:hypothetical protein